MTASSDAEFSYHIDVRGIPSAPLTLRADAKQREALAVRFGIVSLERLEAHITLEIDQHVVHARGTVSANLVQSCAVSGEDLPVTIREPVALLFVPASQDNQREGEEVDLTAEQLDEIAYDGTSFDLGEAVAQTLALAIDPYAVGPGAELARHTYGLTGDAANGPLAAALAALKKN